MGLERDKAYDSFGQFARPPVKLSPLASLADVAHSRVPAVLAIHLIRQYIRGHIEQFSAIDLSQMPYF